MRDQVLPGISDATTAVQMRAVAARSSPSRPARADTGSGAPSPGDVMPGARWFRSLSRSMEPYSGTAPARGGYLPAG